MQTLVLANQKGGVGKSAVATQFAYYLAAKGRRVLVLDLDHQRNTSQPLIRGGRVKLADFTSSQVLLGHVAPLPEAPFALVQGDEPLSALERQPEKHNAMLNALKAFLDTAAATFDVCIIDTNPNPDIRYAAALITCNFVLSPVQLNQEALDGISTLLVHQRYGLHKIKKAINPALDFIGILPNLVEPTPFQRANFTRLAEAHSQLLIMTNRDAKTFAYIPRRSSIAEAQAEGAYLAEMKKTAAREAWREIEPAFQTIARHMKLEV